MKKFPRQTKPLKRGVAEDELWLRFSAGITPLCHQYKNFRVGGTEFSVKKKALKALKKETMVSPQVYIKKVSVTLPKFSYRSTTGLDNQSARKMRQSKVKIQARLDLHGMILTEAHISLLSFLERSYVSGNKIVLVITGKGLIRNDGKGVLRLAVPRWLDAQPMKNWIRGFDHAAPKDGGEGALYVLLRRNR